MLRNIGLGLAAVLLIGCSHLGVNREGVNLYQDQKPQLKFESYITGSIKGWGIEQNHYGQVTKRFEYSATGSWNGNQGSLAEEYVYSDGHRESQTWQFSKLAENSYQATTPAVIGSAAVSVRGNAMNWSYKIKVSEDDSSYKINYDDWMFQLADGKIISRYYMERFGLPVGERTTFIEKQSP